jgi:hypothetical protein
LEGSDPGRIHCHPTCRKYRAPMPTGVIDTWGSSAGERARAYPCDQLLERADKALFRAVTVGAPSELVFAWLCQLQGAPSSDDWIDHLGRRSPRQLDRALTELEEGQRFAGVFRLLAFEPGRSVTLFSETTFFGRVAMTYQTDPLDEGSCRLVTKIVLASAHGIWGRLLSLPLPAGDLFMMRKQLLTLKTLAERDALAAGRDRSTRELGSTPCR